MSTDRQLEQRLQAAAPPPGPPPDVAALWRRARRSRQQRLAAAAVGTTAFVGIASVASIAALRPGLELEFAPGAAGAGLQQAGDPDEAYCAATEPFLGEMLDLGSTGDGGPDGMTPQDYEDSHAASTQQFDAAAAAAPAELAGHWQALQADLAAQGDVWESIDWDPDSIGWPALIEELNSLPTAGDGSLAVEALTDDYEARCLDD